MNKPKPFCVGDKVALFSRGWAAPEMHRVARVLKRFVELDDGSRWDPLGRPYPRNSSYFQRISHWDKADERARYIADASMIARNIVERLRERPPEMQGVRELVDQLQTIMQKLDEGDDPAR